MTGDVDQLSSRDNDLDDQKPARPTVEEKIRYYWHPSGEGYKRCLAEAKVLLDAGAPVEEVSEAVGWSVRQLLRALPPEYSQRLGDAANDQDAAA